MSGTDATESSSGYGASISTVPGCTTHLSCSLRFTPVRLINRGRHLALLAAIVVLPAFTACSAHTSPRPPSVASVTPNHGSVAGGQTVIIRGSGFDGSCQGTYEISFGTDLEHGYAIAPPSYQVLSDSEISAVVPPSFGGTVNVRIGNSCGVSSSQPADEFTYDYPNSQCLQGSCTITVGASPQGALTHAALGFLGGFNTDAKVAITSRDTALVNALHPRQWRLGQSGIDEPGGGVLGLARSAGAQVSLDLTSDWQNWAYSSDRPYWKTPYGDLTTYRRFIFNDVKARMAANQMPSYFDVWNEPIPSGTVSQWLSVYGAAYDATTAADPGAQVVGPSISSFLISSGQHPDEAGYDLSLTDFLNWEMRSGARFAAISWHEDGTTVDAPSTNLAPGVPTLPLPGGFRDGWSPAAMATHVQQAKTLIANYPALARTQVFVNEYGPTYAANVPGWMVGDFASLESAGADQAMLTCVNGDACGSLLDGLIGHDGAPQMPYWVMLAYSQMSGQRLPVQTSGSNLYALATRDNSSHTVQALIGRADACWGGEQCPQFQAVDHGQASVSVSLPGPWPASSVNVTVTPLRDTASQGVGDNDVASQPGATTLRNLAVINGSVTVPLTAVANGDAFSLAATTSTAAAPSSPAVCNAQ